MSRMRSARDTGLPTWEFAVRLSGRRPHSRRDRFHLFVGRTLDRSYRFYTGVSKQGRSLDLELLCPLRI